MLSDPDDVHLPGRTMSALVSENGLEDADGKSFWVVSKVCVCVCVCVRVCACMEGGCMCLHTHVSCPPDNQIYIPGPSASVVSLRQADVAPAKDRQNSFSVQPHHPSGYKDRGTHSAGLVMFSSYGRHAEHDATLTLP